MGVDYMVIAMDSRQTLIDAQTFVDATLIKWPNGKVRWSSPKSRTTDVDVDITSANNFPITISHFVSQKMISTDADPYLAAEIAVWIRDLHPDPNLILWYVPENFSAHVALFPGITVEQIHAGWVNHSEHDPEVEYPQYFQQ